LECVLRSNQTGIEVKLVSPKGQSTYSFGNRSGISIYKFIIEQPGKYQFSSRYATGQNNPEIVLAIDHEFSANLWRMIAYVFAGVGILLVCLVSAVVIWVIVMFKREKALKQQV